MSAVAPVSARRRRIAERFAVRDGGKLLIPYITAGDPDLETTLALMHTLVASGCDIIELGIPFSDPMADGPVIQLACERALKAGTRLVDVLETVRRFRQSDHDTPVVLMGYMNPLERLGVVRFADQASAAGVDGVLTVDLPPEEAGPLSAELARVGLDAIYLLSPTTPDKRLERVAALGSGYLYYVSLKGVTGSAELDTTEVARRVTHIKTLADLPVAVGFGIRDAASAATVSATADAVIVGSALVALVGEHGHQPDTLHRKIGALTGAMRVAMDEGATTPSAGAPAARAPAGD